MRKIILSVAILSLSFANAQDKEVKAAFDAVEAGDISTATAQISAAESKLGGNTYLLEPKYQEKYLFTKGMLLLKSGKIVEGAAFLAKITDLSKSKIYSGKNAGKNKVYYVGKEAADASGISGLKEEVYQAETADKLRSVLTPILEKANSSAVEAYNSKKYVVAGDKFQEVYYLLKGTGQDNEQYLYNAAVSYGLAKDLTKANAIFSQLIVSGYNGVQTTYSAKNKKTGEMNYFEKSTWELAKKDPNFEDFKSETSKNIESEIYEATVKVQIEDKKYDQALQTIEKGLKKFPQNLYLMEQKGKVYYETGKTEEYVLTLRDQLSKNPKDATSWYNLGVLLSSNPASFDESKSAFLKAVELNPTMANAYQNLTFLQIGDDTKAIADFEALKKEARMDEANEILRKRKQRFISAVPYAEKWYELDSNNRGAIIMLKNLYQAAGNEAKYKEFKAKEATIGK